MCNNNTFGRARLHPRMRLVLYVLLSLCASRAALAAPILGSDKQHLDREDKLRDLQALRFPTLDAGQLGGNHLLNLHHQRGEG